MKILIYGSDTVAFLLATLLNHTFKHNIKFVTDTEKYSIISKFSIEGEIENNIISTPSPLLEITSNGAQIARRSSEQSATKSAEHRTKQSGDTNTDVDDSFKNSDKYDLIILTVKPQHTLNSIKKVIPYLADDGFLLSMQTGVSNYNIIAEFLEPEQIILGIPHVKTSVSPSGTVYLHSNSAVIIGQPNATATSKDITRVSILFNDIYKTIGALKLTLSNDMNTYLWEKLMVDVVYNSLSSLLDATCDKLADSNLSKDIMIKLCAEVADVAKANGIIITEDYIRTVLSSSHNRYKVEAPFLQDIKNNIKPDIHGIFNDLVSSSVPTPTIDILNNLIQFKYGGWFHTFPRLAADVLVVNNYKVLLIERKNPPYGWAIPGGFADYGELIETTATRELEEETGIKVTKEQLNLLDVYSDPSRDSRGHIATVVYFVYGDWIAKAADDAMDAKYFSIDDLPDLAFDHEQVINDYVKRYYRDRK